jgi:hypothetical protein
LDIISSSIGELLSGTTVKVKQTQSAIVKRGSLGVRDSSFQSFCQILSLVGNKRLFGGRPMVVLRVASPKSQRELQKQASTINDCGLANFAELSEI